MHTTTNSSVRIYTSHATRWDDCDWGDMRSGHHIDVRAYHSHGHWMASTMHNWHDNGTTTTTGTTTATWAGNPPPV